MTLREAAALLRDAGISDALSEARLLFSRIGGLSQAALYGSDPALDDDLILPYVRRRATREPMAYILGEWGFYRETYFVNRDVLIPREDTEILVDFAVKHLPKGARFADLCTGSGCIALSVLNNTEDTTALIADLSEGALKVARKNAERLSLSERTRIMRADVLCEDFHSYLRASGPWDAVLSNPPYIPKEVYRTLAPEIFFEPEGAFVGEEGGMAFYRILIPALLPCLKENGFLAFEIGFDQEERMRALAEENGCAARILFDLSGHARVAVLHR